MSLRRAWQSSRMSTHYHNELLPLGRVFEAMTQLSRPRMCFVTKFEMLLEHQFWIKNLFCCVRKTSGGLVLMWKCGVRPRSAGSPGYINAVGHLTLGSPHFNNYYPTLMFVKFCTFIFIFTHIRLLSKSSCTVIGRVIWQYVKTPRKSTIRPQCFFSVERQTSK